MTCEARTVVKGTEISTFDAEVVDVVDDSSGRAPRILVRVSGEAVDASGIGFGFSGSPIYCPRSDGSRANAGAISASVGDYGNKLALVTPIEQILDSGPDLPGATTSGRPLAGPLTVSGLSSRALRPLTGLARRAGVTLLAAPSGPLGSFPSQTLVPGSSMAVGWSSGDITISSVGTVTYTDGDRVWGFGHGDSSTGRRSLFLQDAYVFTVVANPSSDGFSSSYKLAAPGHSLGTLSADTPSAVSGRVGAGPPSFPLNVVSRDLDTGSVAFSNTLVADEFGLGNPTGASPLRLVGGLAIAQESIGRLRGTPSRMSGSMCLRVELRGLERPARFCNRYVGEGIVLAPDLSGLPIVPAALLVDFERVASALEEYRFGPLAPTRVSVSLKLRRGLAQAYITGVRAPRSARRGSRIRVTLSVRRVDGRRERVSFPLRVPRGVRPGTRPLTISGPGTEDPGEIGGSLLFGDSLEEEDGADGGPGATTLEELRDSIRGLRRWDGVRASFAVPEAPEGELEQTLEELFGSEQDPGMAVYRHPGLRISGSATTLLRVRR